MKSKPVSLVVLTVLIVFSLDAQKLVVNRQGVMKSYAPGTQVADILENGVAVSSSTTDGNEATRLIVEVAIPVASQQSLKKTSVGSIAAIRNDVRTRMAEVSADIRTIREYTTVVNGFCIITKRKNIAAIKNLAGVSAVHEDVKVTSQPVSTSTSPVTTAVSPIIKVATGKNVKIGIIDTGIDYLHESLGGGIGTNFKVRGGYDFVNNDSDPMDDNGHGTHVGGIIAGDSKTITGMASGAVLYAYKALDASGEGYTSTVLAAIEKAIQDSVKVINMSLGTPSGDPDDILSSAVDRAVASGIVVVVAAGNTGSDGSISSPGTARNALTVGALDANNVPAAFSSRGPVLKNFGIKPDVMAPGVNILSAKYGGGYVEMSGTSMSAPYVTGLAAALCELYPSLNASQIRDAIIESTQPMPGYPYFSVGNGLIDPLKTVRIHSVMTPGLLNLGFNTVDNSSVWAVRETLFVTNVNSIPQAFTFSGRGSAPSVGIQCTPASIVIDPHAQARVIVDIRADNHGLPDNPTANDGYTGAIMVSSTAETLFVPFAFFKGTMLRMQFDDTPWQVIVHDRKKKSYPFQPKSNALNAVLPAGTYDIISTFYPSHYVVREGVAIAGLTDVSMQKSEAVHPITLYPTDEAGIPVAADLPHEIFSSLEGMIHRASGISMISMSGGAFTSDQSKRSQYISDVSAAYVFGYTLNIQKENNTTYTYEIGVDTGIADSIKFRFLPTEVKRLDVKYDIDSTKMHAIFPIAWSSIRLQGVMTGTTYYDGTVDPLRYPFTQTSFYYKRTSPAFPVFHSREAYKY